MTCTPALSIHDKLAQAQYEELLKARVISEFESAWYPATFLTHSVAQAKAVYHKDRFQDCTFDVIIKAFTYEGSDDAEDSIIIASLIVYPVANNNPYASWRPLLEAMGFNIENAYLTLDNTLRVEINKT